MIGTYLHQPDLGTRQQQLLFFGSTLNQGPELIVSFYFYILDMSDREFGGNDDLSLPKATVQKIITEILPPSSGQTFAKDARDLLIECCVEFITLISSEANDISEKEAKKTIACEHIEKALTDLGFGEYVPDTREKKVNKMEQSGLTEEELLQQQQELFRCAGEKYNAGG
ncbi:hypothetical protein GX48_03403 [Paracoccidioides brasiliensis]|nr:hypothetical protein GX48_03403 [Paracoccidioides brasiliensis]